MVASDVECSYYQLIPSMYNGKVEFRHIFRTRYLRNKKFLECRITSFSHVFSKLTYCPALLLNIYKNPVDKYVHILHIQAS